MRSCRNCQAAIPNQLLVDGVVRNLQNRKFCVSCSPFGAHNTQADIAQRTVVPIPVGPVSSVCMYCRRSFLVVRNKGHRKGVCSTCETGNRRRILKQKAIEYKGGRCCVCGYNKCARSMQFHHLDPLQKDLAVSAMGTASWDRITSELDKCVLLCSNCHGEVHAGLTDLKDILL